MDAALKICPKCKKAKNLTEFGKNKTRSDGLAFSCKVCSRADANAYAKTPEQQEKRQGWYQANKDEALRQAKVRWVTNKFDHVNEDKVAGVAQMWSWGRDKAAAEIAKCALVCANCHRERTVQRLRANTAIVKEAA